MLPLLLLLALLLQGQPLPISNFLNNRLIVRRNCNWAIRRTEDQSNLLSNFFSEKRGECLYALSEAESALYLIIEMQDARLGEFKEIVMNMKLPRMKEPPKSEQLHRVKCGKSIAVTFKDPSSESLYARQKKFTRQLRQKQALITLSSGRERVNLSFPGIVSYQFTLDGSDASYNEQLIILWLVFIFMNYQWFYFNKNEGVVLREFRSIKKGWCFKVVSIFWINHTTFPLSFSHEFQKFAEYLRENESELLQVGVLLVLMAAILVFIGFEMGKLMKKVSFFSREQLHIREVADNILIFGILVTPFEYLLIILPVSKLLQIWYLLTLEESHFIAYYEHFGKVIFDWLEGLYFTLYSRNFAEAEPNFTAAAFILSIFIIELMIFLMELFSHREFEELRASAISLADCITNFYKNEEGRRAEIDSCSICLESFSFPGALEVVDEAEQESYESTTIAVTRCNHRFHASCLEKWFRDGNESCPLDRQNLKRVRHMTLI